MDMKQLKLAARDLLLEVTGQMPKIKEYTDISYALAVAGDNEPNPAQKRDIIHTYNKLTETVLTNDHQGMGWTMTSFDPYVPFQNKKLAKKIESGKKSLAALNLA